MTTDFAAQDIATATQAIISSLATRGITATADYNSTGAMVRDSEGRYAMVLRAGWPSFDGIVVKYGRLGENHAPASTSPDAYRGDARHMGHSVGVRLADMAA